MTTKKSKPLPAAETCASSGNDYYSNTSYFCNIGEEPCEPLNNASSSSIFSFATAGVCAELATCGPLLSRCLCKEPWLCQKNFIQDLLNCRSSNFNKFTTGSACCRLFLDAESIIQSCTCRYMQGYLTNPTCLLVYNGDTGHAETVMIHYDPHVCKYEGLSDVFWRIIHDPTSLDYQVACMCMVGTAVLGGIFTLWCTILCWNCSPWSKLGLHCYLVCRFEEKILPWAVEKIIQWSLVYWLVWRVVTDMLVSSIERCSLPSHSS